MKAHSKQIKLDVEQCPVDENIYLVTLSDGEERRFHKPLFDLLFELEQEAIKEKKENKEI